jgi:PAS domain S-box-containing protein
MNLPVIPRNKSDHLASLVENSPDVISRLGRDMRHWYVNPAVEATFGLKAAACLGRTKAELGLPEDVVHAWEAAAHKAFDSGQEQRFDFELRQDEQARYFTVRLIPEVDDKGQIESVLDITYDVTEQTRMTHEREILLARERAARIQAETSAKARDEFLAIVSHELRAPLNGIQSWAHVLENYVKSASAPSLAQRAVNGIKNGIAQQVRLIEDLLDVTRMVSGKLRLAKQPLAFLPAVQAAVESVRPMAAAKAIDLTCNYKITAEQIVGDADRVQQIVWNLLSNAIKFTPDQGSVCVNAEAVGGTICVSVTDNGIGISPEFIPHLFDRFSQEDTSSTRRHSGLGLGLFLVRHLVELHGGRVAVESQGEGQGSTFSIYLPLAAGPAGTLLNADDSDTATLPLPSLTGTRILLIDDQQDARDALSTLLSSVGATVFAAGSAKQATDWLQTLAIGEFPEVLVCDIAMPGEDGYAVLRKIRSWQTSHGIAPLQRIPALALTAFSQREDRLRALSSGFQMHMTKPVAAEELIVVIANLTQH